MDSVSHSRGRDAGEGIPRHQLPVRWVIQQHEVDYRHIIQLYKVGYIHAMQLHGVGYGHFIQLHIVSDSHIIQLLTFAAPGKPSSIICTASALGGF